MHQAKSRVFTIGYEGAALADVVATLKSAGVKQLADIRAVPRSRKPGFSKNVLAAGLEEAGIAYRHFQELGTPDEGRAAVRSGKPEKMHRIFEKHMQGEEQKAALKDLIAWSKRAPTALLCFEREPAHCHRRIVAGKMGGFAVEDLFVPPV
jgi:uncharacterized protein (DUF488 family)